MAAATDHHQTTDDHALDRVPDSERHGWLDISWNTVGIVTALIALFVGALLTFTVGFQVAVMAGMLVAVVGGTVGWGVGHVACKTGLSSTVLARYYGFGLRGSVVASCIFGFMIIGFIAVENVLLYRCFLFYFEAPDTLQNQIMFYGTLSIGWILLTAYGFKAVTLVSSFMLVGFLIVLAYLVFKVVTQSGQSWDSVTTFPAQILPEHIIATGTETLWGKLIFCINILIGSTGALALVDADLGRYARRSSDIGIGAYVGALFLNVIVPAVGGMIMFAGLPSLVIYYINTTGMSAEEAHAAALASPQSVAFAFIVFGGIVGVLLMVVAQFKAQVLNTYSGSLSLANLSDCLLRWRPGRLFFVVLANIIAMIFIFCGIAEWLDKFLVILGVLTICFAGIIIADYFIVRPVLGQSDLERYGMDDINWAGVLTVCIGFVLAYYVLPSVIPIKAVTAILMSLVVYPLLRIYILKPRYVTTSLRPEAK